MDKFKDAKMNTEELDKVAGGSIYWYLRITGVYTDPSTGRIFQDGYLVRGKDPETGKSGSSIWIAKSEWKTWKDEMEWRGHTFREGDSNPNNVDSRVTPPPATPKK